MSPELALACEALAALRSGRVHGPAAPRFLVETVFDFARARSRG